MPSVLDRSALEQSPLADLHLLANELGVDGFRRLRKADLVDAILTRQRASEPERRRGRGRRGRRRARAAVVEPPLPRRRRRARSARAAGAVAAAAGAATRTTAATTARGPRRAGAAPPPTERRGRAVEGAVELLANGSGFLRALAAGPDRRRRLHLRRAGQALRARLRRQGRRPGARRRAAPSASRR